MPGKDGYLGILPGHAALLGQLGDGALEYTVGGQSHYLAIDGGFLEVLEDHVRVLADSAEKAEDIGVASAQSGPAKGDGEVGKRGGRGYRAGRRRSRTGLGERGGKKGSG